MVLAVLCLFRPDRRDWAPLNAARRRVALSSARALVLAVLGSALLCTFAVPRVLAQDLSWGGTVRVWQNGMGPKSTLSLTIDPGESTTYSVSLSKAPAKREGSNSDLDSDDKWFVMVHIDGVRHQDGRYKDLSLIPGFYRTFTVHDWDQPKGFRIRRDSDEEWKKKRKNPEDRATSVRITHEVWDHTSNCPAHRAGPVSVRISGRTPPPPPPPDTTDPDDGNGGTPGSGTGDIGGNGGTPGSGTGDIGGNGGNGGNGGSTDSNGDHVVPTLSISDASAVEGGVLRFRVTLSRATDRPVTVDYRTAGGTAVEGTDYEARSVTLTFSSGTTQETVEIRSRQDAEDEANETFTVTLSDPSGARLQVGTGTGTIIDNDDFLRRLRLVSRAFLPEMARALAFSAVRCRIDQIHSRTGPRSLTQALDALPLSAPVRVPWIGSAVRTVDLKQLLGSLSFAMRSKGDASGVGRLEAWSCGEYRSLRDDGTDGLVDWNGRVVELQLGADIRIRPDMVTGLSLSRSVGRFDYDVGSGAAKAGSKYQMGLTGIHPYVVWSVSPSLAAWAAIGHAWGGVEVSDDFRSALRPSAATLGTGALGVRGRVLAHEMATVTLKGEVALAQLRIADGDVSLSTQTINLRRLRFAAEAAYEHPLAFGRSIAPWGELGLRSEGGDGKTGTGIELGGGVRFRNPGKGWIVEGFGRQLIAYGALPREWGFGASFSIDPDPSGAGLSANLSHSWGRTGSGVRRLWEQDSPRAGSSGGQPERRLELKVEYGFSTLGGRGLVTPFGAFTLDNESGRGYRWGGRFELGPTANLSLEVERLEPYVGEKPVHTIMLRGAKRF